MGVSHSTARLIAPASFVYDFVAQQVGIFSKPSMLDIHNRNPGAFSPQPFFIGGFFAPQQVIQVWWLYKLITGSGSKDEIAEMDSYAPFYTLGNVMIGTWMFFWNANDLKTSNYFVIVNTLAQLGYLATSLKPMNTKSTNSILTHIVAKTFAGIGVLDLLHNTSAGYYTGVPPSTMVKALTGVGFGGLALCSDWIFGGCLVWDLVGLAVGQSSMNPGWSQLLGGYAAVTAAIVAGKNYLA